MPAARKELSLCHKYQFSNAYITKTRWRKSLIFQTLIIWSFRLHSLKYLGSTTLGCRDKGIKNQSLWQWLNSFTRSGGGGNYRCFILELRDLDHWVLKSKATKALPSIRILLIKFSLNYSSTIESYLLLRFD